MRRFCEFSESFGLARDSLSRWRWTRELEPPLSQPPSRPPPSHPFIPPQLAGIKEVGKTKERCGYLAKQIVAFCARCREFKSFARAVSLFTPPPLPLPPPPYIPASFPILRGLISFLFLSFVYPGVSYLRVSRDGFSSSRTRFTAR